MLKDKVLTKMAPISAPLRVGAKGTQVVQLQYALGRLEHLESLVDGDFGPATEAAVRKFQRKHGLAENGAVDAALLALIDTELISGERSVPAATAADALAYLSDFGARGLKSMSLSAGDCRWDHPVLQTAFGQFVYDYWPTMKANRVEADCKTLALFFMDQFRKKVRRDLGIDLARPGLGSRRVPDLKWEARTASKTGGLFSKAGKRSLRPGYESLKLIEAIDDSSSAIFGVNVTSNSPKCGEIQKLTHDVAPWDSKLRNGSDNRKPEIPINQLQRGRLIFMNHDGDNDYDHAITVVDVGRTSGSVTKIVLAVGSFDDVTDADSSTAPGGLHDVNNYTEEVTITLEDGLVVDSKATWTSEPRYIAKPRYSAQNTIMDEHATARLIISRWGDVG